MIDKIAPRRSTTISLPAGLYAYNHAVLREGALSTLAIDQDFYSAWLRDPAEGFKVFGQAKATILTGGGAASSPGVSFDLAGPFPIHDQFPDGRWLVASSRTKEEPNGHIYSTSGLAEKKIMLGDGIEHMKIDSEGRIWVGWFDEGVFGNTEWRYGAREWPPSSEGLACFDDRGTLLWSERSAAEASDLTSLAIADCYALNVSDSEVWASPYKDFPLLHAGIGKPSRVWSTELSGPRALAVRPPIIVCVGSYKKDVHEAVVIELKGAKASVKRRCQLAVEPDNPRAPFLLDGRADTINLVQNGQWHVWNVTDFL